MAINGEPINSAPINGAVSSPVVAVTPTMRFIDFSVSMVGDSQLSTRFINFNVSATGRPLVLSTLSMPFMAFTVNAVGGSTIKSRFINFNVSATGITKDTGFIKSRFIDFTASGVGKPILSGQIKQRFISFSVTGLGSATLAMPFIRFGVSATGQSIQSGKLATRFIDFSVSGSGKVVESAKLAMRFIGFGRAPLANLAMRFINFDVSSTLKQQYSNTSAYVLNVHTAETTRYTNYAFTHIITIGGKDYGVTPIGLYLLDGYDLNINGYLVTKDTDFGTYHSKRMDWLYLNSDTPTTVTPFCDSVQKLPQQSSFGGRKVKLAKGNTARYWQFKIEHIVRLEGIEMPFPENIVRQRRIK